HPALDTFLPHRANVPGPSARDGLVALGENNAGLSVRASDHQGVAVHSAKSRLKIPTNGYSFQLWIYPMAALSPQHTHGLAGRANDSASPDAIRDLMMIVGNYLPRSAGRLGYFDGSYGKIKITVGKTSLQRNRWYLAAFVRDGDQVRLYLNGNLECQAKR